MGEESRRDFPSWPPPACNTALEARPDVLTCTTPVLDKGVEVIGEVEAEVFFRSGLPSADVFVRLCDVDEQGRSTPPHPRPDLQRCLPPQQPQETVRDRTPGRSGWR
ncbi:CocE/NonD family hydrolase C-terminal non-catalytic domain-containing protein [Streptomyces sp. NBC_00459]|uniref:CocE/NonD family hydrolase C-terminal non-catalytic domain-containing protein n=1 Tax=Streptomyces sp. NBC_00459 TaxID=2975749 RepID=UPI002E17F957